MGTDPERRDPNATPHAARRALPVEALLAAPPGGVLACDVLVVGSGYGGSFAAAELARDGRRVWVLERGREYARGEFPETLGELPGHVQLTRGTDRAPRGRRDALFDLRLDEDVAVLVGCGLGGGSLINAGVVLAPRPEVFRASAWPKAIRDDPDRALRSAFEHVRAVLGAAPLETPRAFPKYRALERLAAAIPGASIAPAPIAVTRKGGRNAVGVVQQPCIDCGNCVTGCNHDAKNTLAMNAIPLAIDRGARFWTGARVIHVVPAIEGSAPQVPGSGRTTRWRVRVDRVAALPARRAGAETAFEIHAHTVVFAAGALGSTELLMRSRDAGLKLSDRLGQRFSGNGDQLSFGIGQDREVGAVARPDSRAPARWTPVGPTIVGVVQAADAAAGRDAGAGLPERALLQEAAMPAALRPLLGTLMASAALPHGLAHDAPHAFARRRQADDGLGAPEALVDHCQVLLGMGADAANGCLTLDPLPDGAMPTDERRLRMKAGYAATDPTIARIGAALAGAAGGAADGFDGGWHVPNPLWQALPEGAEALFGTTARRTVTVHPLGGCAMGENRNSGVVDAWGTVFDGGAPETTAVHAGLHVLDGAILPTALGVNPMLTIAALSVRAAVHIDTALGDADADAARPRPRPRPIRPVATPHATPPLERVRPPPAEDRTRLGFAEVLRTAAGESVDAGALSGVIDAARGWPSSAGPASAALATRTARLMLEIDAAIRLSDWIASPAAAWTGTARLSVVETRPNIDGDVAGPFPVGEGTCRLELLSADPPAHAFEALRREVSALGRFVAMRPRYRPRALLSRLLSGSGRAGPPDCEGAAPGAAPQTPERGSAPDRLRRLLARLRVWRRVLARHGVWRAMRYEVRLDGPEGREIVLRGAKRLAYAHDAPELWTSLLNLDVDAAVGADRAGPWRLQVDVPDLLRRGVFRIDDAPDTPTAIAAVAATGAQWLRAILGTHLWAFPGPETGVALPTPQTSPPTRLSALTLPEKTDASGAVLQPEVTVEPDAFGFDVDVSAARRVAGRLTLRLSRYRHPSASPKRGVLLMVHGLAHSAEVFVTRSTPVPLAARFVADGWDVFLLDHRLSAGLGDTPRQSCTIDDIGAHDIPGAFDEIDRIRQETDGAGLKPIHVFAHCVGAAAVAMAVLSGRLTRDDGTSRIAALVLHAVHPWTVPSAWNRVSAALAGFYKDFIGDTVIDPIPRPGDGALEGLVDALAGSIPWSPSEWAMHEAELAPGACARGHAICNRMTLFYGREWRHANLTPATHQALHTMLGPAHVDVFRHIFFLALRQRLTDANGDNVYLDAARVGRYWTFPTLFATGQDNRVFDPQSAARSYLALSLLHHAAPAEGVAVRPGRAGLYLPAGVGHMDFLFGRFNHEPESQGPAAPPGPDAGGGHGLHDTLAAFLADPDRWLDAREEPPATAESPWMTALRLSPQMAAKPAPWTGPLLRYRRAAGGDAIEIDVWFELHPHRSEAPDGGDEWPTTQGLGTPWRIRDLTREFAGTADRPGLVLPGFYRVATAPLITGLNGNPTVATLAPIRRQGHQLLTAPLAPPAPETGAAPSAVRMPSDPIGFEALIRVLHARLQGLTLDVPLESLRQARWVEHLRALLTPDSGDRTVSLLLASCRWPGLVFERAAVDGPVRAMLERVGNEALPPIDALFLLGDEIYADAFADAFELNAPAERAARRYREALSGDSRTDEHYPNAAMRDLLARVPCWSVVDDHEFVDDWAGVARGAAFPEEFRRQFAAAVAYQWRSPPGGGPDRPGLGATRRVRGLWQPFEVATLRCFALDTRTERTVRTNVNGARATVIGRAQHRALSAWLTTPPAGTDADAPPLILCGSPIGLPRADERDVPGAWSRADDWHGYPASCRALLRAILDAGLDDVVMLCGDPHYSCVVQVEVEEAAQGERSGRRCRLHVIVASGLNASLPFANGHPRELLPGRVLLPFSNARLRAWASATPLSSAPRQYTELAVHRGAGGMRRLEVTVSDERGARVAAHRIDLPPAGAARGSPTEVQRR